MVGAITTFLAGCSRNLRHRSKYSLPFTSGAAVLLFNMYAKLENSLSVHIVIAMYLMHHNIRQTKIVEAILGLLHIFNESN